MFSGTRKDAREKFNKWAETKRIQDMIINTIPFRTRDSISEEGILIVVFYDP
jgi:hypothetical protein